MTCEWDKYPMGTVDVNPGWQVQMLCPNANDIAEQQVFHPNTWYIGGNAGLSGQADIRDNLQEDIISTISSISNMDSKSNYQQSTAGIYGTTVVSGQNS